MGGFQLTALLLGVAYITKHVVNSRQQPTRPKWVDDLILQSYAGDWHPMSSDINKFPNYNYIASLTNKAEVPVMWGMSLSLDRKVPDDNLSDAIDAIVPILVRIGPPDGKSTVNEYREFLLNQVASANGGKSASSSGSKLTTNSVHDSELLDVVTPGS